MFSECAANLEAAAKLLLRFTTGEGDQRSLASSILEHEHVGDKIVHDIIQRLNQSFITPIDREDIYQLVANMDDVLDHIEAGAAAMVLYKVGEPTQQVRAQAEILSRATELLRICIDGLAKPKGLEQHIIAINSLENEGDRVLREAVASLFDHRIDPIEIIKWKDVYEMLEAAIDECEHVANVIETIVIKHN